MLNIIKQISQRSQAFKIISFKMMSSTGKFKVFVTKPIPDEAVAILKSNNIELDINETVPLPREKLLDGVRKGIDGLYCTLNEKIDKEVIDAAGSRLKVIGTCSVGFDHVDYRLCKERNIPIGFTPGVLTGWIFFLFNSIFGELKNI